MCVVLLGGPSAFAGATVDFVVTDFGNTPCGGVDGCTFSPVSGPFHPGESVLVHVMLTSDTSFRLRGAQIDWRASSPDLVLGQDIDAVNQPLDGISNFWFDYSPIVLNFTFPFPLGTYPASGINPFVGLPTTGRYTDFSNLFQGDPLVPFVAATIFAASTELPGMLQIEAGRPYRIGGMPVTLPTEPGHYTLDVLNLANTDNSNFGMVLHFGFGTDPITDPLQKWASAAEADGVDDVITYANGPLTLIVMPEPTTLVFLCVAAGLGALRASRKARQLAAGTG